MAPRWFNRQKNDVEEEVMSILEESENAGAIKEEGRKMINAIFEFDDKLAHEIMTPRTDVFMIDIQDDADEYIDELMELRYSRIPVYDDDVDNIIGVLNIKDMFIKAYQDGFENIKIRDILRKAYFVPDTKNIDSLFFELQKQKQHIALLIDEYGGFSGIVTMEDIIEEIVGDIDDEYDEDEIGIVKLDDNTYMVDGYVTLSDLNDELDIEIDSENSETVGGLVIEVLDEIPDENAKEYREVEYMNIRLKIESVKDRRVEKVKLTILSQNDSEEI